MSWNSVIDGDWGKANLMQPPWTGGVMTLSHEEVLQVQTEVVKIVAAYVPAPEFSYSPVPPDNEYIVPKYNQLDWEKCINGDTYAVIKQYDPSINLWGINNNGVVPDPDAVPEQPNVEEPVPSEEV
jgi:hypothetical protein